MPEASRALGGAEQVAEGLVDSDGRKSVESLVDTLNSVSQRLQALWFSFVSFAAYVTITVLGTTHRMLFLEEPVKLPVFNIDLPLTSFYVLAPLFLLIFHFYLLLQLLLLARTASIFEEALNHPDIPVDQHDSIRTCLDNSVFLQMVAGAELERRGRNVWLISPIAWLTVIVFPVGVFLLIQLQFLPYHDDTVTTIQRWILTIDVALICLLWPAYSHGKGVITSSLYFSSVGAYLVSPRARSAALVASAVVVVLFSCLIAVFPTERHYANWLTRLPGTTAAALAKKWPRVSKRILSFRSQLSKTSEAEEDNREAETFSFTEMLLEPPIDYVMGQPRGFFSNTIVLPDKRFVNDEAVRELDKSEIETKPGEHKIIRSLRGRDLARAVLSRADLRRTDFTGANLDGAKLDGAWLQRSRFNCADRGRIETTEEKKPITESDAEPSKRSRDLEARRSSQARASSSEELSPDNCARLRGASLQGAKLHAADLQSVQLQDADLSSAELHDASFVSAQLQRHSSTTQSYTEPGCPIRNSKKRRSPEPSSTALLAECEAGGLDLAQFHGFERQHERRTLSRRIPRLYAESGGDGRHVVEFRGSQLTGVRFQGAELDFVEFEHVNVLRTEFQGASFKDVTFQNTLIDNSYIWRTVLKESPLDGVILRRPNEAARIAPGRGAAPTTTAEFVKTRDDLLANISDAEVRASIVGRLARLDPTVPDSQEWVDAKAAWAKAPKDVSPERQQLVANWLIEFICQAESAPYLARGVIRNGTIQMAGNKLSLIAERLRNEKGCAGAKGLTSDDLTFLANLEKRYVRPPVSVSQAEAR